MLLSAKRTNVGRRGPGEDSRGLEERGQSYGFRAQPEIWASRKAPGALKLLLDTSVIIDHLRGHVPAVTGSRRLASKYATSHRGVDTVDYILAAAAQVFGATLCTRNRKHFPMFPRLAAPYR